MGKTIYNMKLHETICIESHIEVMRVSGGWIYFKEKWGSGGYTETSVFVPYIEETAILPDEREK